MDRELYYSIDICWDKLDVKTKKAYTQKFLEELFDHQMHLYSADLNGWQLPIKRLVQMQAGEVNKFFTLNPMKKKKGHIVDDHGVDCVVKNKKGRFSEQ